MFVYVLLLNCLLVYLVGCNQLYPVTEARTSADHTGAGLVWYNQIAKHYLFLGAAHSVDMAYSADLG